MRTLAAHSALRTVLAVAIGVALATAVLLLVGFGAEAAYPTPPALKDAQTPEETAARVDGAQTGGLLLVLVGTALGGVAGGAVSAALARTRPMTAAAVTALALAVWGIYAFYVFYPARLWFPLGMLALFPGCALLAGLAVRARLRPRP